MVRVKILKAGSEYEEKFVGGVYEAFRLESSDGMVTYAVHVETNNLWYFCQEYCEEVSGGGCAASEEKSTDATNRVLMVEDGSVDIDALEEYCEDKGIYVLVYRQGSNKPEFLS